MGIKHIVVGIDGSGTSLAAAHWAARDAARRKLPVHVVLAYEWAWHGARFSASPWAAALSPPTLPSASSSFLTTINNNFVRSLVTVLQFLYSLR